jgi:hypothetical protein
MTNKKVVSSHKSGEIIHPLMSDIVIHDIGMHPVHFGSCPKCVQGEVHHLVELQREGLHVVNISVLRTKKPRPDTHMVLAIRQFKQMPATVDVVHAISQLGFKKLSMLFADKTELMEKSSEISLACLGSFIPGQNPKGIIFRVLPKEIVVDTFSARNPQIKLPTDLIFPFVMEGIRAVS